GFRVRLGSTVDLSFTGIDNLFVDTRKGADNVTVEDIAYPPTTDNQSSPDNLVNVQIDLGGSIINTNAATKTILRLDSFTDTFQASGNSGSGGTQYDLHQPIHTGTDTFTDLGSNVYTNTFNSQFQQTVTLGSTAVTDNFIASARVTLTPAS